MRLFERKHRNVDAEDAEARDRDTDVDRQPADDARADADPDAGAGAGADAGADAPAAESRRPAAEAPAGATPMSEARPMSEATPMSEARTAEEPVREPEPVAYEEVADEEVAEERIDLVKQRWSLGTVLTTLAGAALVALGIVALLRTEVDDTWYRPVEQVLNIDHTPLLAAIEIGVGAALVLLGLAGARVLTALVCLAVAVGAVVVAVDPSEFREELAMERWWAITLAAAGVVLALLVMASRPGRVERHYRTIRRPSAGSRRYGRAVPQH